MSTDKNIFGLLPEYCFVKIGGTIYALEQRVREFLYNNGGLVNDNI